MPDYSPVSPTQESGDPAAPGAGRALLLAAARAEAAESTGLRRQEAGSAAAGAAQADAAEAPSTCIDAALDA
jgi:hypothetical protein